MLKLLADAGVIPNNACMHSTRSRVHALTHAHAYTRTHMQRLYGKLDADSELPEVEDIEQIMAATIKQTAHEPDQGAAEDQLKPPALQPPPQVSFAEKTPAREGDDEGLDQAKAVSDVERRQMLRTERRKRMADREAARGVTRGGVTFADAPSFDDTAATTDACEEEISEDAEANLLSRTAPGALVDKPQLFLLVVEFSELTSLSLSLSTSLPPPLLVFLRYLSLHALT